MTDTEKRTILLALDTLARLRRANRMDRRPVDELAARLRREWFGDGGS